MTENFAPFPGFDFPSQAAQPIRSQEFSLAIFSIIIAESACTGTCEVSFTLSIRIYRQRHRQRRTNSYRGSLRS